MKIYFVALSLVLLTATTVAEEYKSITTAGYSNLDFDTDSGDDFSIETSYYFSGKESLGPRRV
ncbi:hypothetical protein MO867_07130 [Microbulbifer sp. OS29]|uniref:Porin n=1 Tax=Microbulbifer okhotskensis TaxID=2926617 RepID=A0A9X2EKX1_9GAMM|nr:hypothetical protein [Microbulbifer okhotskensis]MCO1334114.1 hypothetical protein [Microbulbifer okhotskensis]